MSDIRYWSKDMVANFIKLYQASPCLWRVGSKEYSDKPLRARSYERLAQFCRQVFPAADRDFVTKKIQSLRGCFRKELKKVLESKINGASPQNTYEPSLWYYHLLLFTVEQHLPTNVMITANTMANHNHNNNNNSTDGDMAEECDEEYDEEYDDGVQQQTMAAVSDHNVNGENDENQRTSDEMVVQKFSRPPCTSTGSVEMEGLQEQHRGAKRKLRKSYSDIDVTMEYNAKGKQLGIETSINLSEHEAVGVNVARKLNRMQPKQALYAESLIQEILHKGLLEQLSETIVLTNADDVQTKTCPT